MFTRKIHDMTEAEYQAILQLMDGGFRYHGMASVTVDSHNAKAKILAAQQIYVPETVTEVAAAPDAEKPEVTAP